MFVGTLYFKNCSMERNASSFTWISLFSSSTIRLPEYSNNHAKSTPAPCVDKKELLSPHKFSYCIRLENQFFIVRISERLKIGVKGIYSPLLIRNTLQIMCDKPVLGNYFTLCKIIFQIIQGIIFISSSSISSRRMPSSLPSWQSKNRCVMAMSLSSYISP